MAESGQLDAGLRYSTRVHKALNLTYVLSSRNLNEEERAEFDGWVTATMEQVAEWNQERKQQRVEMIYEMGEVG